jgi:hypothetical protein
VKALSGSSTETVEKPVESAVGDHHKSLNKKSLEQCALCDSSMTRARDLRDGTLVFRDA